MRKQKRSKSGPVLGIITCIREWHPLHVLLCVNVCDHLWCAIIGIQAGKLARDRGWAINIGGGFHHCSSSEGGGFCAYADITLCIKVNCLDMSACVSRVSCHMLLEKLNTISLYSWTKIVYTQFMIHTNWSRSLIMALLCLSVLLQHILFSDFFIMNLHHKNLFIQLIQWRK